MLCILSNKKSLLVVDEGIREPDVASRDPDRPDVVVLRRVPEQILVRPLLQKKKSRLRAGSSRDCRMAYTNYPYPVGVTV